MVRRWAGRSASSYMRVTVRAARRSDSQRQGGRGSAGTMAAVSQAAAPASRGDEGELVGQGLAPEPAELVEHGEEAAVRQVARVETRRVGAGVGIGGEVAVALLSVEVGLELEGVE